MNEPVDIDALLARYAPVGRRERRRRALRRATLGTVASAVTLAAAAGLVPALDGPHLTGLLPASPLTSPAAEPAAPALAQTLARQQALWQRREAALEARIADLTGRLQSLEEERAALLAAAQSASGAEVALRSEMEAELQALRAERQALRDRRSEFETQRERLEQELDALLAQRSELEKQRQALELQRLEFETLLDRLDGAAAAREADAGAGAPADRATAPDAPDAIPGERLASVRDEPRDPLPGMLPVGDERLGDMRGAFRVPGGYDVSLGITQSASVNGVEQFSNTLSIGDTHEARSAEALLIQVGDGNIAGSGLLDALGNGMGTVIQNSTDEQLIQTRTVIDLSVEDVSRAVDGLAIHQALDQSLGLQR